MYLDYYNYIALVIFALFALFIPLSFLFASKLLRPRRAMNPVRGTPYESAEEPIGRSRDIVTEYLPYFVLFLPFEIIAMLLVLWSIAARGISIYTNLLIIGLAVVSMALALVGYRLTNRKEEKSYG